MVLLRQKAVSTLKLCFLSGPTQRMTSGPTSSYYRYYNHYFPLFINVNLNFVFAIESMHCGYSVGDFVFNFRPFVNMLSEWFLFLLL